MFVLRAGAQLYRMKSTTWIFVLFCVQISREDAQAFARENRIHYMEASAKNRYNVDEVFLELVQIIRYTHYLFDLLSNMCFY